MKGGFNYNPIELQIIRNNWKEFAEKHNGKFKSITGKSKDTFVGPGVEWEVKRFELILEYLGNQITFKVSETHPLKVRYDFNRYTYFDFIIYNEDIFERISKLFGSKDIKLNLEKFDKKYIIQGSKPEKVKVFFDTTITDYLIDKELSNFKLERKNNVDFLEITILIDLLENGNLEKLFEFFKNSINKINELKI